MAHRPLVVIISSFIIGISLDNFVDMPVYLVLPATLTILLVYIASFILRLKGCEMLLILVTILAGISYHHYRFTTYAVDNISCIIEGKKIPVRLRGVIITTPITKNLPNPPLSSIKQSKKVSAFLLQVELIEMNEQSKYGPEANTTKKLDSHSEQKRWKKVIGTIKVKVYPANREERMLISKNNWISSGLKYGDRIEMMGHISRPHLPRNPAQFNYKKYLQRQNPRIDAVAAIISGENIKLISVNNGNYFISFIYKLKKRLNTIVNKNIRAENAFLVNSILLGDREGVPEKLMDSFLKTGTIHFLAISGLHVGILIVSLHCFLRLIRVNTKLLAIIIIIFTITYASVTGMKTPITRAGIMVAAYYGAYIFNRRWDLTNSIAVAVFVILLVNPSELFNVGFQLSVSALLGIIYFSGRTENFFWKSTLLVEKLQAKEERNEIWYWLKIYCRKTLCVSLAAWMAVMPLIAHYFHICTPMSVIFNIIVFPLIWLILVIGFIVLILGLVFPLIVYPFAWLVSYSAVLLEGLVITLSTSIKAFFYTSGPAWLWIFVYYLVLVSIVLRERIKIKRAHILILILIVANIYVLSGFYNGNRNQLKLTCFDVRHGASIFIQFPNGKNMLYDTGTWNNFDVGKFIVAPYLWQEGIKKIDTIVISHEHGDHCNGIPSIIERFKVGRVFVNKYFLQSGNKQELLNLMAKKNIKIGLIANGMEIDGYAPAGITVLNPPDKDVLEQKDLMKNQLAVNDTSSVLLIEYSGYKILLCADIDEPGIEYILSRDIDINADIIQVPHHGGANSKTEDLIRSVKPKHAIINGTVKLASKLTLEAYNKHGAKLYKTYEDGAITFTITEDGIQASTFIQSIE